MPPAISRAVVYVSGEPIDPHTHTRAHTHTHTHTHTRAHTHTHTHTLPCARGGIAAVTAAAAAGLALEPPIRRLVDE